MTQSWARSLYVFVKDIKIVFQASLVAELTLIKFQRPPTKENILRHRKKIRRRGHQPYQLSPKRTQAQRGSMRRLPTLTNWR